MNNIGTADLKLLKELYPHNYEEKLKKLEENYPIQYLIGYVDFYNTKINVNENVLIPRFETELLMEKTLNFLKNKSYISILDIGTGSGAIALTLKKYTNLNVYACDISKEALDIAKKNSYANNLNINFFLMDILKDYPKIKFDCLISNPPYVKENETVSPETKYEPQIALYAKNNGLEFYERILSIAPLILNQNGSIIFEIGANQKEDIKKIALKYYPKATINTYQDYNNYDRFMFIET